jgi:hypothetical protein
MEATSTKPQALCLDAVKEPVFTLTLKGKSYEFEPFELADKLQAEMKALQEAPSAETFKKIRDAVGIPELSSTQCFAVLGGLFDFIKNLPEVKKLSDLTQSSSASTRA